MMGETVKDPVLGPVPTRQTDTRKGPRSLPRAEAVLPAEATSSMDLLAGL